MITYFDIYLSMGLAWALYGVLGLIKRKNRKDRDTFSAMTVLICFTIHILDHLIKPSVQNNLFYYISSNIYFLAGPAIWFYTLSLTKKGKLNWQTILLHSLPFIIWLILTVVFKDELLGHRVNIGEPLRHPPRGRPINSNLHIINFIKLSISYISVIIYMIFIQIKLFKHSKEIKLFYSYKSFTNTIAWLRVLTIVIIPIYFVQLINEFLKIGGVQNIKNNPVSILTIFPVVYVFLFSFFSQDQKIPKDTKTNIDDEKYKKSNVDNITLNRIYKELLALMKEKKLFLDSEINLDDLSKELDVSKHTLSQVLNTKANKNFYTFINEYRLEMFKEAVKSNRYPNYSLLAVAMECGFRSSSTFYSTFKKMVGTTPKEYIKSTA